jgi:hypothetical protein
MYATEAMNAGPRKGKSLLRQGIVSRASTFSAAERVPESKAPGLFSGRSSSTPGPFKGRSTMNYYHKLLSSFNNY